MIKLVLLLLIMSTGQAEASLASSIVSSIFGQIWAGIKWVVSYIANAIWTAIKNLFIRIGKFILNGVSSMANDIFAAINVAQEQVKSSANKTLSSFLGPNNFNTTKILINMMFTGTLPPQWYLKSVDLDEEMEFLDHVIEKFTIMSSVALGVSMIFNLICGVVLCWYCRSKANLLKVNKIEERESRRMNAVLKKSKDKIRKQIQKDNEYKRHLRHVKAIKSRH